MKKLVLCLSLILAIAFGGQALAATLYFSPIIAPITVGESVDIDVIFAEFEGNVGAFDFDVLFNDAVLVFDSYSLTENLGNISMGDADDWSWGNLGGGTVNLAELSWLEDLSFQTDPLTLATLTFTGIGAGTSFLSFNNVLIGDWSGDSIGSFSSFNLTCVAAPVPEPGTFLLFGVGILGLVAVRVRGSRKG